VSDFPARGRPVTTLDHLDRFILLFALGLGTTLAGASHLLLLQATARVRWAVSTAALFGTLTAAAVWQEQFSFARVWSAAGVALVATALFGSPLAVASARLVATIRRRRAITWGSVVLAGVGITVAAAARFEAEDQSLADRQSREMERLLSGAPLETPPDVAVATDRGRRILVKALAGPGGDGLSDQVAVVLRDTRLAPHVIHRSAADDGSNCHGWVFTAGRYWVGGDSVDLVIADNGYEAVREPQPGDLVVYRDGKTVRHTAVVRYVTPGMPVLVEGKWGRMGVFLHPAERSVYGTEWTFYRSRRAGGHLLAGVTSPDQPSAVTVAQQTD
jgi:hypothetical protein